MDSDAVSAADDETLKEMGISTKGDLVALRAFCEKKSGIKNQETVTEEREKKRAELAMFLKEKRYRPSSSTSHSFKKKKWGRPKEQHKRKIELGWLHRKSSDDPFTLIRSKDGGGTRSADLPVTSRKMDIIMYAKKLFFPDGKNSLCSEEDVLFSLGNFSQKEVGPTVMFPDGSENPFNLENYCHSTKLTKIRLYLMTTLLDNSSGDEKQVTVGIIN